MYKILLLTFFLILASDAHNQWKDEQNNKWGHSYSPECFGSTWKIRQPLIYTHTLAFIMSYHYKTMGIVHTKVVDKYPADHRPTAPPQPKVETLQDALSRCPKRRRYSRAQIWDTRRPHGCMRYACADTQVYYSP